MCCFWNHLHYWQNLTPTSILLYLVVLVVRLKTTIQYKNLSQRPNLVLLPFQFGRMILKAAQTRFWPPALFSTAHRFFPRRRYMWRLFSKKRSFIAAISNFGLYTLLDGILVKLICSVLNGSQRLQKCNTHFTGYSSGGSKVFKFPETHSSKRF